MPIYEFDCRNCGNKFEELLTSGNEKLKCPECHNDNLEKKFSVFGFSGGDKRSSSAGSASCGSCHSRNCSTCH